ncbi:hypothetical protein E8E13_007109 [Curvularia kusanoi]|uniref:Heterokaryon incompatibility domain-containing protein n=1 Tax=Curvularia kusanoi TaxID=90978 RepID=A0A9P4WBW9_CURKU|nr:hypothetical protein E8E13_007109 [Curvularia kusanoi]
MKEPYDVVNMKLTVVPSELESFVRVDLETEYGTKIEDNIVAAICEPSDGNINSIKLRLDQIRDLDTPTDILSMTDRLPREIVAFFDAEIKRISVMNLKHRYQTLLAIIAVAAHKSVVNYVPKRLIDIGSPDDKEPPDRYKVVLTGGKSDKPYVTLSHSWGPNPNFLTLTTERERELMSSGFSSEEIGNKNFEEAIEVARTLSACETLPEGLPFVLAALATTDRRWRGRLQRKNSAQAESRLALEDSLEKFWKTAVLNYTSCNLTNQADKTFAIWSVAKLVRDNLQHSDQYGCGLWSIALHEQLAWQVTVTKPNARLDTLLPDFPSWSWASVNAPIQVQDRIVLKRSYTVKNHQGSPISFGDFKNNAENRDMQPIFAASASLAIRGYLIPGQLTEDQNDGALTFESGEPGIALKHNVVLDENPTESLFAPSSLRLLPLVAQKTNDIEVTYTGNALVLVSTEDHRQIVRTRLQQHENSFEQLHKSRYREDESTTGWEPDLLTSYYDIKASKVYLAKMKEEDQNPSRKERAFRRVGVVRFDSLDAHVWERITAKSEEMIWLD